MYEVEDTHFWYQGMRSIAKTLLNRYLVKKKNIRLLDAGCGTGKGIIFLQQYGKVDGFDISKEAVRFCHLRGLKQVITGSIDKIPYKDNTFDAVICFDVLGQREVSNDQKAVKEFYRVLKPGGILLIRIAAFNWLYGYHDVAVHTKQRYNAYQLKKLFKKIQFQELKITYANLFLFPLIVLVRIISRIFGTKGKGASDVDHLNPILNKLFYYPLFVESILIRFISLPFGLSIIGVAKKPISKEPH